jgi:hypothetical protein
MMTMIASKVTKNQEPSIMLNTRVMAKRTVIIISRMKLSISYLLCLFHIGGFCGFLDNALKHLEREVLMLVSGKLGSV